MGFLYINSHQVLIHARLWGTSELCLEFCAPDVAPPWRMLYCTRVIPSMGQRLYCTQQRTLRFSVGNCTKYKVQTFRVATWTSADLVLSRLNFTKPKEAPCLPIDCSLHRWVLTAQEPWVCMAHLPLGCSRRSRPATSATGTGPVTATGGALCLTPSVGEQADWVANAQETCGTEVCIPVTSQHKTAKSPCSWNQPRELCSLSSVFLQTW